MDASLLALGVTLFAAALVPLTAGRLAASAGIGVGGAAAWGTGALGSPWTALAAALGFVLLLVLVGLLWRSMSRRTRSPSHNS